MTFQKKRSLLNQARRVLLIIIGSVIGSIFLIPGSYSALRFFYFSKIHYSIKGIDISHHQGIIDWNELEKEKIDFVYMKATEGGDFVDPKFNTNWEKASHRQISKGAYHFYRACKGGIEQANNFISVVPKAENSLPHAVDIESVGNCKEPKSKEILVKEIAEYIKKIKEHYGKTPIIYTSNNFYRDFLMNDFSDMKIWIRDISNFPALPDNRMWHIWQFSHNGRVRGIENQVDLNVFYDNKLNFQKFIAGQG